MEKVHFKRFFMCICAISILFTTCVFFACNKEEKPKEEQPLKAEDVVDFVLDVEGGRQVRILQLTDIQIIDSAQARTPGRLTERASKLWATDQMENVAFKFMRQIVKRANPDLIVLTGDNVYGEFDDNGSVLKKLVAEMESYKIPWTATFGNHDNESILGVEWQCQQYIDAPHCMFKRGDENAEGNGNFTIGIRQNDVLTEILYLMDSHGCVLADKDQGVYSEPGFMPGQMLWFEKCANKIRKYNDGKDIKSLAFFHHPVRAYGDAMVSYGYVSARNDFYPPSGNQTRFKEVFIGKNDSGDYGNMHEDVYGYIDGNYVFDSLFRNYGGEGMFFGHNHTNNCSVAFNGVRYTYGLKASEYDSHKKGEIGGTLILVGDKFESNHIYYDSEYQG